MTAGSSDLAGRAKDSATVTGAFIDSLNAIKTTEESSAVDADAEKEDAAVDLATEGETDADEVRASEIEGAQPVGV